MDEKKIAALLEDEKFVSKIAGCGSIEEVRDAFGAAGCDITAEQAKGFVESLDKLCGEQADELSEENLEDVSGGFLMGPILWPTIWTRALLDRWLKKGWLSKIKWKSLLMTVKR